RVRARRPPRARAPARTRVRRGDPPRDPRPARPRRVHPRRLRHAQADGAEGAGRRGSDGAGGRRPRDAELPAAAGGRGGAGTVARAAGAAVGRARGGAGMRPPAAARALVWLLADAEDRHFLLEDLANRFDEVARTDGPRAARRWYWRQALSVVPWAVRARLDPLRWRSWTGMVGDLRSGARTLVRHPLYAAGMSGTIARGSRPTPSAMAGPGASTRTPWTSSPCAPTSSCGPEACGAARP